MSKIPVITEAPEKWPLPGTRCIFRGHLMDYETAAFLMAMESHLGYELTVEQGCYNAGGVAASAGTHDGGGVFDLAPWDWERKVHVARILGGASWHRTFIPRLWGEHIHTVIRNHPTLSAAAHQQQVYFDQKPRKNGLAGEAVDPDQGPKRPTPTFRYPPKAPPSPTFRTVSLNDDWGNKVSDVPGLIDDLRPLAMGVQEGWQQKYSKVIPKRWGCRQVLENKATAGVAVIWDRRRLAWVGKSSNPRKRGAGLQVIGKGADTRNRPVVWRDVMFRPGVKHGNLPRAFRIASVHRPPMRDRASWDAFDATLETWMKLSPLPVLLFIDSNEHGGPTDLTKSLAAGGYTWHEADVTPRPIDGALTKLPVKKVEQLAKRTSDHHPVVVTLG